MMRGFLEDVFYAAFEVNMMLMIPNVQREHYAA